MADINDIYRRVQQFRVARDYQRELAERVAILNAPPYKNPPALMTPTRVRVLRPFHVAGEPLKVNDVVTVPFADARSLAALGRAKILD